MSLNNPLELIIPHGNTLFYGQINTGLFKNDVLMEEDSITSLITLQRGKENHQNGVQVTVDKLQIAKYPLEWKLTIWFYRKDTQSLREETCTLINPALLACNGHLPLRAKWVPACVQVIAKLGQADVFKKDKDASFYDEYISGTLMTLRGLPLPTRVTPKAVGLQSPGK